ncbi:MAG: thiolase family protein [Chloroflexia bacterium]
MRDVVIVSGCRTAIGAFGGALSTIPATELGAIVIREAVRRAGIDPSTVDEVIMGCVVPAGLGQAPARQAAVKAGIPVEVGATTINKVCGSGLKAVMLASAMIQAGDAEIIVAGGMENMNLAPFYLPRARTGYRMGGITKGGVGGAVPDGLVDGMVLDGLWCAFANHHMGSSAEWIAREFGLTREELDEYAYHSHRKAVEAIDAGRFKAEIVPVEIPQRKGPPQIFDTDENPRRYSSKEEAMSLLSKLRPAFEPDGIVTAGNSPGITDGAAALVVMSADKARELGLTPMARITAYDQAAVEPIRLFTAPIYAVQKVMKKLGVNIHSFDLIEANEAFAAQAVADGKALGWDWERVNVNGGAIALGHPIGCSGARILVTLLYALKDRGLRTGIATLCLGGGEAVALSVEML